MSSNSRIEDRINILLVDDSPRNLLALETVLRAPDRNLVRASCGEEALRYLLDNEAAVVLLDVYMPGIDGLETAELIRRRKKSHDIPIIFLTANTTGVRHLTRGYLLGAVDYIVKPVEPDILRSKVAVFVDLFKKNREIKRQAQLLREKNLELENANLERLNMLIDLGQELTAQHDPLRMLVTFCRSSRKIIDAEEVAVGMLEPDGKTLRHFVKCNGVGDNISTDRVSEVVVPFLNRLVIERRALRSNSSSDFLSDDADSMQSFLGAPIFSASDLRGWVYFLGKAEADDFSEADERLAVTLATQVGVAYENATLYTNAQNHAAELSLEIAERKRAENERAQLLIRERAARADAESANRTKDEFLAMLSHELRTPLTAILGWSHIIRGKRLDEAQLIHGIETIERNARSQSQLIDDLLDVSRIVTGKLQIDSQVVNLSVAVEAAIESVRPSFETKGVKLEGSLGTSLCPVQGDAIRLQQVFWNLLSNALKFTPKAGKVTVSVHRDERDAHVSITDTGIGINPDFLPHIFQRFRQADGSTTRAHGGLGLGLSIVRHLVELHGGTIEAQSDGANRGATFRVSFPIAPAATTAPVKPQLLNLATAAAGKPLDGLKILVVDDEPDSRDVVQAILTRFGSEVRCSESVNEALRTFKEWSPDLLVTDIGMPNEDGFSLIKKLRKLRSKRARKIPAIALTAYATEEDRAMAVTAGFQIHLAKPIEPEGLVNSIATVLGRPTSAD